MSDFNYTQTGSTVTLQSYSGTSANVTVPATYGGKVVTSISDGAFIGNTYIITLVIPASVTLIGNNACANCTSITAVTMYGVISIGVGVFLGCNKLSSVLMDNANKLGASAFEACSILPSIQMNNVTSIGNSAFAYCYGLSDVRMDKVTSIGNNAFYDCTKLQTVSINAMQSIGTTFQGFTSLKTVSMNAAKTIAANAFQNCTSLTSAVIPASVILIGDSAFYNCRVRKYNISKNTLSFGRNTFESTKAINPERVVVLYNPLTTNLPTPPVVNSNVEYKEAGIIITLYRL
jgi:hypothetical protein